MYLRLSAKDAAAEMAALDGGGPTPNLDRHCLSCAACNVFCPHGAEPYDRILQHFYAGYLRRGLPERARYLMPTLPHSFREDLAAKLPADEKALVAQWARNEPAGEVLYPGCNLLACAYLTKSGVFDDLTVAGRLDLCCGEMYYRLGMTDLARRFGERLTEYYAGKPIERMVFVCPACLNMFQNLLPQKFGARFDFPMVFVADYLLARIESGDLPLRRPVTGTVVVHDSCHGRLRGAPLMDSVRTLLRRLGLTVVEAGHSRESGYCCGIAAGAPRQSAADVASALGRVSAEYALAKGQTVAAYCTGCAMTLGVAPAMGLGKPVRHLLDFVADAMGRPTPDRLGGRSRALLAGVLRHSLPAYLSSKRFWMK